MKYTKEALELAAVSSLSVAEVTRKLGLKNPNGGTNHYVSGRIKKFGIDTSHFLGKRRNKGPNHRGGNTKLLWQQILVLRDRPVRQNSHRLRRAMIESGISHVCDTCGIDPEWNDKVLVLQISHKNGDSLDNRKENLKFECPNCHSQTEDFAGRGKNKNASVLGMADRSDSKSDASDGVEVRLLSDAPSTVL